MTSDDTLRRALQRIDQGLAGGPPTAREYAHRMTEALGSLQPSPSAELQLAVRAQHFERWKRPRADYPAGRAGYLRWRKDAAAFQAGRVGEELQTAGCSPTQIAKVQALIRKERLATDADAQCLEDCACIVFLKCELEGFAGSHDRSQVIDILRKTWRKMSPKGQAVALELSQSLAGNTRALIEEALNRPNAEPEQP